MFLRWELADKETMILKGFEDREELVKKIKSVKLAGDSKRARIDAATIKDY